MAQENLEDTTASASDAEHLQTNDSQNPLKAELERVRQERPQRTQEEKAIYSYKQKQEELRRLGIDPSVIDGVAPNPERHPDDDATMTVGMFKRFQEEQSVKSAKELLKTIEDPIERELVEFYLDNKVRPSGDPQEDITTARYLAYAKKNDAIVEMSSRKPVAQSHSGASGAPAKSPSQQIGEFTETEKQLLRNGLTTEDKIRAARSKFAQ